MLNAQELKAYAETLSVPASGVCSAEPDEVLLGYLQKRRKSFPACGFEEQDLQKRINPKVLMPEAKSVFVCIFPYHISGLPQGNLSHYAMVPDYHQVIGAILEQLAHYVKSRVPGSKCLPLCDTAPTVDRWLAYRAGLGFYGKNNLLIHPVYGSYFFIGSLLLDIPLQTDQPLKQQCNGCNACICACPGQALSEDFGFDCSRCISYITQKREITGAQERLLEGQGSVYGCDVCQQVCPHNRGIPDTPLAAFYENAVTRLEREQLAAMSNREFRRQYGGYAFSWCSKQTILKNFQKKE